MITNFSSPFLNIDHTNGKIPNYSYLSNERGGLMTRNSDEVGHFFIA